MSPRITITINSKRAKQIKTPDAFMSRDKIKQYLHHNYMYSSTVVVNFTIRLSLSFIDVCAHFLYIARCMLYVFQRNFRMHKRCFQAFLCSNSKFNLSSKKFEMKILFSHGFYFRESFEISVLCGSEESCATSGSIGENHNSTLLQPRLSSVPRDFLPWKKYTCT